MDTPAETTNRPRPVVRIFAVCTDADLATPESGDLASGWWELKNFLHTVWMPPGVVKGFGVEELFVYAQLTDGVGAVSLGITVEEINLTNSNRNRLVGRSNPEVMTFNDTWEVVEVTFKLVRVPFPRPGQYHFRLMENGQQLEGGSAFLRVLPGD